MDSDDALKLVLGTVAALLLVRLLFGLVAMTWFGGAMHIGPAHGAAWLLPVGLVVAALLALVVVSVAKSVSDDDALEELRRAYARGDVDEEEFERRREKLQR